MFTYPSVVHFGSAAHVGGLGRRAYDEGSEAVGRAGAEVRVREGRNDYHDAFEERVVCESADVRGCGPAHRDDGVVEVRRRQQRVIERLLILRHVGERAHAHVRAARLGAVGGGELLLQRTAADTKLRRAVRPPKGAIYFIVLRFANRNRRTAYNSDVVEIAP